MQHSQISLDFDPHKMLQTEMDFFTVRNHKSTKKKKVFLFKIPIPEGFENQGRLARVGKSRVCDLGVALKAQPYGRNMISRSQAVCRLPTGIYGVFLFFFFAMRISFFGIHVFTCNKLKKIGILMIKGKYNDIYFYVINK